MISYFITKRAVKITTSKHSHVKNTRMLTKDRDLLMSRFAVLALSAAFPQQHIYQCSLVLCSLVLVDN